MGEGARSFERVIPRVGLISRATIRAAMAQLQREYGFSDIEAGFTALQEASQMHNIKTRTRSRRHRTCRSPRARRLASPTEPTSCRT
jgi:hypothetical protein